MDTTLSDLTFAFLFSLPRFFITSLLHQFGCSVRSTVAPVYFLREMFTFLPFLADKLDLARVGLGPLDLFSDW